MNSNVQTSSLNFNIIGRRKLLFTLLGSTVTACFSETLSIRKCRASDNLSGFQYLKKPLDISMLFFQNLSGEKISLSAYSGEYLLLHKWATWCGPCVKDLGNIQNVLTSLPVDISKRILLLAVQSGSPEDVGRFLKGHHFNIPTLVDKGDAIESIVFKTQRIFGSLPANYLIDDKSRIVAVSNGIIEWNIEKIKPLALSMKKMMRSEAELN